MQAAGITSTGSFLGGSWAAFGSIPLNPQTGSIYAQQLSTTGNVTCAGSLFVGGVQVTPGGSTPAVGQILKSTRVCMNPHNSVTVANSGSTVCSSLTYTPVSAQSTLNIIFTGTWLVNGATNGHGQWYCSLSIAGVEIGTLKHGTNLTIDTLDASPIYGQYINSSTSALTISVVASRHFGNQNLIFFPRRELQNNVVPH